MIGQSGIFRCFAILVLAFLALLLVSSCSADRADPLVRPAEDRPTFVWIFSDP